MSFSTLLAPSCRMCMRTSRNALRQNTSVEQSTLQAGFTSTSRWGHFGASQQQQKQQARHQSTNRTSLRVRDRPSLFLHPLDGPSDQYALSFLPEPPLFESSPTVLGLNKGKEVTPRTFEENPDGRRMLHEILRNVYTNDPGLQTMAVSRGEGFIHIIDERNPPALHRAGEPEDIIASVLCKDGQLLEGHYEEGYTYRYVPHDEVASRTTSDILNHSLVSSNGPIKLSDGLTEQLVQGMRVARSIEKEM